MHDTNLDFVRTLAVLLVAGAHLLLFLGNPRFSFLELSLLGTMGVVVFFVHSAIVNMMSIDRHVEKYGSRHLFAAFMIRRSFRIFPLSMVVVSAIFFLRIPASGILPWACTPPETWSVHELLASLALVQNFVRGPEILSPLWSLPYEIQLYLFFPLLFPWIARLKTAKPLYFAWAILATLHFVLSPHLPATVGGVYFRIPNLLFAALQFLPGFIAYLEMKSTPRTVSPRSLVLLLAMLMGLFMLSYDKNKYLFVALTLGLLLPHVRPLRGRVLNALFAWIAKYSYGIYLLHFPALWIGFTLGQGLPMPLRFVGFMVATFGGSYLLYHVLERPMIALGNRLAVKICSTQEERVLVA